MPLGFHPTSVERGEADGFTDRQEQIVTVPVDSYFGRGGDCRPDGHGLTPSGWFHAFVAFKSARAGRRRA